MTMRRILAGMAAAAFAVLSAEAAENPIAGLPALAGTPARVAGELQIEKEGLLARRLVLTFADRASGELIKRFDEELAHELHIIAVDEDLSTFVHEHAERVDPDGRFRLTVPFPKSGRWHVYADAVPTGIGQQVLRFDVAVDGAATKSVEKTQSEGVDGPYSVKLDPPTLRAGEKNALTLSILRDGKPADDLGLYLGVPAHAVFIAADNLAYVHAHAMRGGGHGEDATAGHGAHGEPKTHGGHGTHGSHAVSNELRLHVEPPRPGRYAVWIQFIAGGAVRTISLGLTAS